MDQISEMIVFVAEDELGNEGIVTMHTPGAALPMVLSNLSNSLAAAVDQARTIARSSGRTVKMLRFSKRHEMIRIDP